MTYMGSDRQIFFPAGTVVPSVSAEENTNGWYSVSVELMQRFDRN